MNIFENMQRGTSCYLFNAYGDAFHIVYDKHTTIDGIDCTDIVVPIASYRKCADNILRLFKADNLFIDNVVVHIPTSIADKIICRYPTETISDRRFIWYLMDTSKTLTLKDILEYDKCDNEGATDAKE